MHPVRHPLASCSALAYRREQAYEPERWHQFLIYIGLTLGAFIINAALNSTLPAIYRGACTAITASLEITRKLLI